MTKQEVLHSLMDFSEVFPREALIEIQKSKSDYILELLESLDYVCKNARKLRESGSDYFLHTYAMYLLAEFKEKRAFPLLIALLRLLEDDINFVWGDSVTEGASRLLLCTYDEKHLQILLDVIENPELYEWARLAAVSAYELLMKEGFIAREEGVSYLRSLIYDKLPPDDSYIVYTGIVGCVIHARIYDMIPDILFLYDNDRVDCSMYGNYDDFVDLMFYKERLEPTYIEDAISEMEWWACFKQADGNPKRGSEIMDKLVDEMEKGIKKDRLIEQKPKKVGRNEPCPCGSGKKYKKCCIDQNTVSVARLEDRYDLLDRYPKNSDLFGQMYEKEAIAIDMLVYKALHHRAIPIWEKRDHEQERLGKIDYLYEALTLFNDKCHREKLASFSAYDERFMVHYRSRDWVLALIDLVKDDDSDEHIRIQQIASDVLQRFS